MSSNGAIPWQSLEQWSPIAFVVGGLSWLGLSTLAAANMSIGISPPYWLMPAVIVGGLLSAYIGLFGFYPRISPRSPRLSLAGAGITLLAASLAVFAVLYTVVTSTIDQGPPFPVFPLILISTILGFLLMGIASVRTAVPSRRIGYILIIPGAAWFADIVFIVASSALGLDEIAGIQLVVIPLAGVVIASMAMVAIGYLLYGDVESTGHGQGDTQIKTTSR